MSNFTQPLTVTKVGARLWRVERAFEYHVGWEESPEIIKVPRGFITNFASSPRFAWVIIPPDGLYTQACVLHDFCYFRGLYTRKKCDEIFLEAMAVLGVAKWKRLMMFWAVRIGGFQGWNFHRKQND